MGTPGRRRRHDPLAAGHARSPSPIPSTIDLHTHTTRSDGVVPPADLVAAAAACGVTFLALTDHDTLAGYREVVAAGAVPPTVTLVPGVEINALVTRDLGLWEGELHILGFGMDPADEAFEAVLSGQRDQRRIRFERTVAAAARPRPVDRRPGRRAAHRGRGRPRPPDGRPRADGRRARDERRGRVPAAARLGQPGLRAAGRRRTDRGDRGDPGRRRHALLAHFGEARSRIEVVRELIEGGLRGLEVYYRSFDAATTASVRRWPGARPRPDRRQRLPRRPRLLRRGARRPVGPAGGRRWRAGRTRRRAPAHAMTDRSTLDRALPMLEFVPPTTLADPRRPAAPDDARLAEYLPEARALPRFHVWTLGCQMNRSDSEEMAGRLLPPAAPRRGASTTRTSSSSTPARSAKAPSRRSSAGRGSSREAEGRQPGPARRADRLLGARAGPGRAAAPLPGGRPLPAAGRGARARRPARAWPPPRRPIGAGGCAPRSCGPRSASPTASRPRARRPSARHRRPRLGDQRLAADHLRLRQDLHLLHRPVQPRPGAEPPVRRDRRRGAHPGRRRVPRGHAARPERQLVRPRPAARGALRARRRRALGRPPAGPARPPGPRRAASAPSTACGRPTGGRRSGACAS